MTFIIKAFTLKLSQFQDIQHRKERRFMITSLTRINELAQRERTIGLTYDEIRERSILRQHYLAEIRGQVLSTMKGMTVMDVTGADITPQKLRDVQ